ncbi:MAG: hypothetical protein H0X69_13710 [Gemmatimonadales bacterium]|nr:hypothetical protein [Gemmatimonadales bacterium]
MLSRGGLPEVPCPRCERRVVGLAWGELCPQCHAERAGRASRIATRISLAATLLMGLYVAFSLPHDPMARIHGAVAVLATYIIVRRIASRVAMETMK